MKFAPSRLLVAVAITLPLAVSAQSSQTSPDSSVRACRILESALPGLISFPGSRQYDSDIEHWAFSSSQNSTCSVEPQSADDVSKILRIIGRPDIMVPFAVKGGGHALNRGHSSTPGVQISMAKFNGVEYDASTGTVTIGTGLTWAEVYSTLESHGVMVTGGRITGVGVAGLSLGGGTSWKTNQFGLTIDTIVSHNVVLPSGQQVLASNRSYADLFFGLKGGLNNFGIVTSITFETHPQDLVYGGMLIYGHDATDDLNRAISDFSANNMDPKAAILPTYSQIGEGFSTTVALLYDGPDLPAGVLDAFLAIPTIVSDVKRRSFFDFIASTGNSSRIGIERVGFSQHVVSVTDAPKALLDLMVQQTISFGERLSTLRNSSDVIVTIGPQIMLNPFSHSRGGAYPHEPSRQLQEVTEVLIYDVDPNWTFEGQVAFHDQVDALMIEVARNIHAEAINRGVSHKDDILYPNYAIDGTPIELMYGSNVPKLRATAAKYDPRGVMKLTGGPHF